MRLERSDRSDVGLAHNSVHVEVEIVELSTVGIRICDVDWDSDVISVGILNLDFFCLDDGGDYTEGKERAATCKRGGRTDFRVLSTKPTKEGRNTLHITLEDNTR